VLTSGYDDVCHVVEVVLCVVQELDVFQDVRVFFNVLNVVLVAKVVLNELDVDLELFQDVVVL